MPWLRITAAPAGSLALMIATIYLLQRLGINAWLAVAAGGGIYLFALAPLGAFRGDDMTHILNVLPLGPLKRFAVHG